MNYILDILNQAQPFLQSLKVAADFQTFRNLTVNIGMGKGQ